MTRRDLLEGVGQFPKLDLPRAHVRQLSAVSGVPISEPAGMGLEELLNESSRFTSGRMYRRSNTKHILVIMVNKIEQVQEEHALLGIRYDASQEVQDISVPKDENRESEFISTVSSSPRTWDFVCKIEFEFVDVDEGALWFPLPSRIDGSTESPESFLITGVRATQLGANEDAKPEYNFALDRHPDGRVSLELHFFANEKITVNLPSILLARGAAIARQLVGLKA